MKVIVTTLNSKFIHSNLAIRYLKSFTEDLCEIDLYEYTINEQIDDIAADLYSKDADLICFSTYIWNINETLDICKILKLVNPKLKILLGGPEVSFDGVELMGDNNQIDYIISGEGEETFRELIGSLVGANSIDIRDIDGLIHRDGEDIIENKERALMKDLNIIPTPYKDVKDEFKNKIIYYESSRGCPFNCAFCLSSTIKGVRYFDIERVKSDLATLIDGQVRQVKFVDRTFNANKEYAKEIMNFIKDKDPDNINFHFEVTAHLLDDDMLDFISHAKEGLFQFEIGVQSTNDKTIDAIGRTTDFEKLSRVTRIIKEGNNIHQHLDLIAGLPYEDYESFGRSFDDVYNLKPEKIQLGFLKMLKGSKLRSEESQYGYKYLNKPPYEVLENDFISYSEIIRLRGIEDLVDKYYNEGYFSKSIDYIIESHYDSPFLFFEEFLTYWEDKGYDKVSHSRDRLYEIFKDFVELHHYSDYNYFVNLIKFDYIFNSSNKKIPKYLRLENENNEFNIHDVLKDERLLEGHLREYKDLPTKKIINNITIENFTMNPLEDSVSIGPMDTYIMFIHSDGQLVRCRAFDIGSIVKELM